MQPLTLRLLPSSRLLLGFFASFFLRESGCTDPDGAGLINVLGGEFEIARGFPHSLRPARGLFFGSPAVYIMVICLLLRATMLTVPTTGFCDLPLTVVGTGANASTQNSSYVPLSDQLGFGGLSARHTSCTHPGAPAPHRPRGVGGGVGAAKNKN